MEHISITTDFGAPSGAMKGVIWSIAPQVQIADLTWDIRPQDLAETAWFLDRQVWFFPAGSVHIVVVDPGVGSQRRPLAARIGEQFLVAPDNGVLSLLLLRAERSQWPIEIVHTEDASYWQPQVSEIFHGRDIFAPVGAHLANGVQLAELGTPLDDPVRLQLPFPIQTANGVEGEITMIYEHFGNLITNIQRADLAGLGEVDVSLCGTTIEGMSATFSERPVGSLVAVFDECDYLYIAEVEGNAARRLSPSVGTPVSVTPRTPTGKKTAPRPNPPARMG